MAWTFTNSGSASSKTAGTTLAHTVACNLGETLYCFVAFDNTGTSTPTVSSITKKSGEAADWSQVASFDSPVASSAGGVRGELWMITPTTSAWSGVSITITLDASVTARADVCFRVGATAGESTVVQAGDSAVANTDTSTTDISAASGDTVIGFHGSEETYTLSSAPTTPVMRRDGTSNITPSTARLSENGTSGSGSASNLGIVVSAGPTGGLGTAGGVSVNSATAGNDGGYICVVLRASAGPYTYQVTGTIPATATSSGAPTSKQNVTGSTAATATVSGAPYALIRGTAGTSPATSATSGDVTVYSTIKQVAGTVAVVAGSSAAPTSTQNVSGTSAATSATSGAPIIEGSFVELRRNLHRNPTGSVDTTDYSVNTGSGGIAGTISRVAADTSLVVESRDLSYVRLTLSSVTTPANLAQSGLAMSAVNTDAIRLPSSAVWGQTFTFSVYVRDSAATRTSRLWMRFFNDSSGLQGGNNWSSTTSIAGAWTRLSVSATIPTNSTRVWVMLEGQTGTDWAVNETIDAGGALAEISGSAGTYFDGDTPDAGGYDYQWVGTAGASQSVILAVPVTYQVTGTAPASAAASGTIAAISQVSGASAATVTTAGAPYDKVFPTGTIAATAATSGAPTVAAVTYQVAGTVAAATTVTGAPYDRVPAAGVSAVLATSSGAPTSRQQLTGTSALTSTVSGAPYDRVPAAGTSTITSAVSGDAYVVAASVTHQVSGTVAASAASSAAPTSRQRVTSTSTASTVVSGAPYDKVFPSGTVTVTSTVPAANPSITTGPTTNQVSGTIAVTVTSVGTPTSRQRVSSTSAAVVITVGSVELISGTKQVSGTIPATALTSGSIRMRGAGAGTISVSAATSAAPTSRQRVSATTAALVTTSGSPIIYGSVVNGYWGIRL